MKSIACSTTESTDNFECIRPEIDRKSARMVSLQSVRTARTAPLYTSLFLGVLVIAAFAAFAAFSGGLLSLVDRWTRQEEYSHGFLIPFVAAWMLWSRRDALVASVGEPSWSGPVVIIVAAIMLIVGELSAFFLLMHVGFVVALLGIQDHA